MKRVAFLLMIVAASAVGCDKPQAQDRHDKFDAKIDGKTALPAAPSGKTIVMGTGLPYMPTAGAGPTAASAPSASADAQAQVKAIVKEINAAVEAGDTTKVAAYLAPEQAKLVKPLMDILAASTAARLQLEKLVISRFGEPFVKRMQMMASEEPAGQPTVNFSLSAPDPEKLTYDVSTDKVVVSQTTEAGTKPMATFVLTNGQWQMHKPELEQPMTVQMLDPNGPMISARKAMGDAEVQIYAAIGQGIENGTISPENFDSRVEAIKQEKMSQLAAQMMAAPPAQGPANPVQPQAQLPQPQAAPQGAGELETQINVQGTMRLMGAP